MCTAPPGWQRVLEVDVAMPRAKMLSSAAKHCSMNNTKANSTVQKVSLVKMTYTDLKASCKTFCKREQAVCQCKRQETQHLLPEHARGQWLELLTLTCMARLGKRKHNHLDIELIPLQPATWPKWSIAVHNSNNSLVTRGWSATYRLCLADTARHSSIII